jgi:DNA-binding transcriptional MerR regulator
MSEEPGMLEEPATSGGSSVSAVSDVSDGSSVPAVSDGSSVPAVSKELDGSGGSKELDGSGGSKGLDAAEETVFTVDELAAAAGLPVRTVRHYQSEKLLPAPSRQGRIALYRNEHLERLQLIARLQDRGLKLSAIRDAFRRVEKGELWLDDWLGVGDELRAPWSEERPIVLSEAELADRVAHQPGTVAALVRAGVVRRQQGLSDTYLVPSPAALDITLELDNAGVDIDTATEAAEIMRKHLKRTSAELVEHFQARAGAGFARRGSAGDIAEALKALRPLGARAIQLVFTQEIERSLREAAEQGRITPSPSPAPDVDGQDRPAGHSAAHESAAQNGSSTTR